MSAKVVCLGEIMMRLSPPGYQRFIQAESFDVTYGGGEANVAVSLAHFGLDSYYVTKVPAGPLGQAAINHLRRFGVHTDFVARGGSRLGIYFLENGAAQRASKVVYDRAHSAIAEAAVEDFDWEGMLAGAVWFHLTGITPALSEAATRLSLEALRRARAAGCTVSCDLNYRKNLWSPAKAREVMTELMSYVDVCVANEEDADKVFGITAGASRVEGGRLDRAGYEEVAAKLRHLFGFQYVAITLRESRSASDNGWSGLLYDGTTCHFSRSYDIHIVDRVGGGDAFAAGLIYSLLTGSAPADAVEFAVAASCLKHSVVGDFNMVTVDEVESLLKEGGSGRVQR